VDVIVSISSRLLCKGSLKTPSKFSPVVESDVNKSSSVGTKKPEEQVSIGGSLEYFELVIVTDKDEFASTYLVRLRVVDVCFLIEGEVRV
jgi:hypothetical protein